MTKDEQSLLLYFETCLVDQRGKTQSARMNTLDFEIAKNLDKQGLIKFNRIPFKEIEKTVGNEIYPRTHRVQFTDEAWKVTHRLRREKAQRYVETFKK